MLDALTAQLVQDDQGHLANVFRQTRRAKWPLLWVQVVLDTLVQRLGDAAAAAAFAGLRQPALGFGPTGYAAVALPVCLGWAVLGARLGRRQQVLHCFFCSCFAFTPISDSIGRADW